MFNKGEIYRRRDLHEKYGGQQQGGISTPANHNVIFLFTAARGEEHGYKDGWVDKNTFLYTGEGQRGPMTFLRGNKAIRDHLDDGKQLHLFKQTSPGYVEYIGEMVYRNHRFTDGPDTDSHIRKMIVFELSPIA